MQIFWVGESDLASYLNMNRCCCASRCASARGAAALRLARALKSFEKLSEWSGRYAEPAENFTACVRVRANYCELPRVLGSKVSQTVGSRTELN